jgi:hypothetical protein
MEKDKIITAIGTGSILIIAGDLLCSPFVLSSSLRKAYNNLVKVCKIHKSSTETNNQFIENEKNEATERENSHAANEKTDVVLFYFGNILTAFGFSFLLLVFASDKFYGWVSSIQPFLTIISFIFLLVCMMIREYGELSLEKVSQKKELIMNIASLQLQQEHQKCEDKA